MLNPNLTKGPNYQTTIQKLYRDSALHFLANEGISEVLGEVDHPATDDGFPSWAPRWDLNRPSLWMGRLTPLFRASDASRQVLHDSENLDILRLEGFKIDTVEVISGIMEREEISRNGILISL